MRFFKYFGVTPKRIASFDSFEKNQNPRIVVSFSYFKSLKELIVLLKEPTVIFKTLKN